MKDLVKSSQGLILKEDFNSLAGWTTTAGWTTVVDPALISFGKLGYPFTHGSAFDKDGVREPTPFLEDGVLHMLYDGGDGTNGWTSFKATSRDFGVTWQKTGQMPPGYADGSGGNWAANAMGYINKFNGKYYYYRVLAGNYFPDPNVGLPAVPYSGDIWEATNIEGPYTYKSTLQKTPGTLTQEENLPCSTVFANGIYHMFIECRAATGNFQIARMHSTTPFGPWTLDNTAILNNAILGDRIPENADVFFHPTLNKWVMLVNLINESGGKTDQNAAVFSDAVDNWTGAKISRIQRICPMDGDNAIGVISPIAVPGSTLVLPDGTVPIYYDTNPEKYSDSGWHFGRQIRAANLIASKTALKFEAGTAGVVKDTFQAAPLTDFVAQFAVQFTNNTTGTNIGFWYRANTSLNGYKLLIRNGQRLQLLKYTAGTPTTIFSATTGIVPDSNWDSRIRLEVSGNSHKCYIDGELQINVTDSAYASGSHIGYSAFNASNAKVRALKIWRNADVSITGLVPSTPFVIRTTANFPVDVVQSNSEGVLNLTHDNYPLTGIELNGIVHKASSDIYGGDIIAVNPALPAGNNLILAEETKSVTSSGLNAGNTQIITRIGNPPVTHKPGRQINFFNNFEESKAYLIKLKSAVDIQLSTITDIH